jgi:hypothetical protein
LPGHEDCDLDPYLSDAAAAVLDPAHETIVTEANSRANPRVDNEISHVCLKAEGIIGRRYVTVANATCLNNPVIILKQSARRIVAFIADCPYRQQLEMKQNKYRVFQNDWSGFNLPLRLSKRTQK